jgi:FMN phosphatase YigB (HAD superfamily)
MEAAGSSNPQECLIIDDTIKNLIPAHEIGWTTVWVGSNENHPGATYNLPTIHNFLDILPILIN